MAHNEGRRVVFRPYNGQVKDPVSLGFLSPAERAQTLMNVRRIKSQGGTNTSDALRIGMDDLDQEPKADIILVTDGQCRVDEQVYLDLEASPANLSYVMIGATPDERLVAIATQSINASEIGDDVIKAAVKAARRI